jgi:hypothetical protein
MRNGRFHTPKYRGNLQKMGVLYTHPSPRSWGPCYIQGPLKKLKMEESIKIKKLQKKGSGPESVRLQAATGGRPLVAGRPGPPFLYTCLLLFLLPAPLFFYMWSTLPHWLHHMLALPKLLLKTSNTYNFWSVGPKNMKFVVSQILLRGTFSQKNSKDQKKI